MAWPSRASEPALFAAISAEVQRRGLGRGLGGGLDFAPQAISNLAWAFAASGAAARNQDFFSTLARETGKRGLDDFKPHRTDYRSEDGGAHWSAPAQSALLGQMTHLISLLPVAAAS